MSLPDLRPRSSCLGARALPIRPPHSFFLCASSQHFFSLSYFCFTIVARVFYFQFLCQFHDLLSEFVIPAILHPLTGQQTQTLNMPKADKPVRKTKATRGETGGRRKKGELSSQLLLTSANKRLTDPNAPKRGLSAYMFFANDNRDKVREENPGISFGKIMWLTHDGITRR